MTIEETIFKMMESANELYALHHYTDSAILFRLIDRLCDKNGVEMPDEAVSLNVALDETLGTDVFDVDLFV